MLRRARRIDVVIVAALALAGVGLAHVLEYLLLVPDHQQRQELLAATGHQYLPSALGAVSFLAFLAVAVVFLAAFRRSATPGPATTSRHDLVRVLPCAQALAFLALEVGERLAAGVSLGDLGPVLLLGLPLQVVVGIAAAALLALLDRAGERLGRCVAGTRSPAARGLAGCWFPSPSRRGPSTLATRRAPARAPPAFFVSA
jgi:hypothetical protein